MIVGSLERKMKFELISQTTLQRRRKALGVPEQIAADVHVEDPAASRRTHNFTIAAPSRKVRHLQSVALGPSGSDSPCGDWGHYLK
jgi:hypothetical protein